MSHIKNLLEFLDGRKVEDIALLDMRSVSPLMDFMVVGTVSNPRLMDATAQYLKQYLDEQGRSYYPISKSADSGWVLVDAKDVVIHLFLQQQRELYNLEKLWSDCLVNPDDLTDET
ncbi:MAG TPA: ribosome silencing factor [Erysipelothrix sp.]|nr:ribosome silencing factor [Erysipelothrix sp.]